MDLRWNFQSLFNYPENWIVLMRIVRNTIKNRTNNNLYQTVRLSIVRCFKTNIIIDLSPNGLYFLHLTQIHFISFSFYLVFPDFPISHRLIFIHYNNHPERRNILGLFGLSDLCRLPGPTYTTVQFLLLQFISTNFTHGNGIILKKFNKFSPGVTLL